VELWTALIGLIGALAGAGAGAWLTHRLTANQAKRRHLSDRLLELYTDAYVYAYKTDRWLTQLTWHQSERTLINWSGLDRDLITAKMLLLADVEVRKAWTKFAEADEHLRWELAEVYDPRIVEEGLKKDDLVEVRHPAEAFIGAVHDSVGKELPIPPRTRPELDASGQAVVEQ